MARIDLPEVISATRGTRDGTVSLGTKRHPADRPATSGAYRHAGGDAEERDQRRGIDGPLGGRFAHREPSPSGRRYAPSDRNGTARNPRARCPPRSSPTARHRPIGRLGRAPSSACDRRIPDLAVVRSLRPLAIPARSSTPVMWLTGLGSDAGGMRRRTFGRQPRVDECVPRPPARRCPGTGRSRSPSRSGWRRSSGRRRGRRVRPRLPAR